MRHTISMRTSHLPYYRSQSDTYRAAPTGDSQYTCTLCGKMSCRLFGTLAGYEHTSSSPSFRIWSHSVCLQVAGSPSYMAPDKVGIHISWKKKHEACAIYKSYCEMGNGSCWHARWWHSVHCFIQHLRTIWATNFKLHSLSPWQLLTDFF